MPLLPWEEVEEGVPDRRRVFTVRSDIVRSQKTGKSFTVDRLVAGDWVNVVCTTTAAEIVLVRQWRFGARAFTLELPAGLVERDEEPLVAGLRELKEETGYAPTDKPARMLGSVWPNPAFMNNRAYTILVENATLVAGQSLDPMEEIEIVTVPVAELDALIARGELQNALTFAALLWWRTSRA